MSALAAVDPYAEVEFPVILCPGGIGRGNIDILPQERRT